MTSPTNPTKKKKAVKHTAVAVHASDAEGVHHIVGLGNIRVLIVPDDGSFFAQGIDIDYAAQGDTIEDVKKRFETGLIATIEEHLRVFGSIERVLTPAPPKLWYHFLPEQDVLRNKFFCVTTHEIPKETKLPYSGIDFLVAQSAMAS